MLISISLHWYLAIVCNPCRLLELAEDTSASAPEESSNEHNDKPDFLRNATRLYQRPAYDKRQLLILTLDSLGGSHSTVINNLWHYLCCEAGHKKSIDIHPNTLKANAVSSLCGCPQQEGFSDCGIFLLHFVQKFLEDPALATAHVVSFRSYASGFAYVSCIIVQQT